MPEVYINIYDMRVHEVNSAGMISVLNYAKNLLTYLSFFYFS